MGRHSLKPTRKGGKHRAVRPKTNYGRRMLIASSAAMAMALYPVAAGDGTGNQIPVLEFIEEEIPVGVRPEEIADRGEVTTEPTEEPDQPVDEQPGLSA